MYEYTAGLKQLLHSLKYHNGRKYLQYLTWLLEQDKGVLPYLENTLLVPVPLHADRIKERGYNQTSLIFQAWAGKNALDWAEPLSRIKATTPQWLLGRKERRQNIKDAFKITRPETVRGRHIIVVDDIITSGATLEECATALSGAGALSVGGGFVLGRRI